MTTLQSYHDNAAIQPWQHCNPTMTMMLSDFDSDAVRHWQWCCLAWTVMQSNLEHHAIILRQPCRLNFYNSLLSNAATELTSCKKNNITDVFSDKNCLKYERNVKWMPYFRKFASLCVTACREPLSHNTLRNLTVTSNSDQIHCDYPGKDGLLFHIPSQLGSSCWFL